MSIQAMNWAIAREVAPPTRKFVLVLLANYADERNTCFPGQELLARNIGICTREVRRHIAALEEAGLISRERRQRVNGSRTSDRFTLNIVDKATLPDLDTHRTPVSSGHPGPNLAGTSVLSRSERGSGRSISTETASQESQSRPSPQPSKSDSGSSKILSLIPRLKRAPAHDEYTPEFERTWSAYPKRQGDNSKMAAFKKYKVAVRRGATPAELQRAVERYAAECKAHDRVGTEFVKMASTFFGPNEHWKEWVSPPLNVNGEKPNTPPPRREPYYPNPAELQRQREAEAAPPMTPEEVEKLHHSLAERNSRGERLSPTALRVLQEYEADRHVAANE
jgi:helix-turn-helix protein